MKKYGKKGAEGGVRGRRARPWQRHVQGHRCRRILQCVTRLEFGVRLFGVSVRLFLFLNIFFFLFYIGWLFAYFTFFFPVGCSPRKCQFTAKNVYIQTHIAVVCGTHILPIRPVYANIFVCAHISWRTCSWPCLRKLAKGVGLNV